MELRHLRYFVMLAKELNFNRAAEKLHISQPPLSRQIKELEEDLGVQLFYRSRRRVEITNAGKIFLKKAHQILDQVEQARISTRLSITGREGELRIGFTGAAQDFIPTLKMYRERFPHVGIILKQMNTSEQLEALNENQIDIALLSVPIDSSKIEAISLGKMDFVAILPENHRLVTKQSIYLEDLANETFIMTPRSAGTLFYEAFMGAFKSSGFTPKVTVEAHDLQTVLALVVAEMGITLSPSPIHSLRGIVRRKIADIHASVEGSLAWSKENNSNVLQQFLAFFNDIYREEMVEEEPE